MAPRYESLLLWCAAAVGVASAASAYGQLAPASPTEFELLEPQRDRLFAELAADVQAMERELGLVKRVVRLVTPTVVHIEARPLRDYRVRGDLQEAGSGVIARIAGADYVVTNRHVVKNSSEEYIRIQLADGRVLQPRRIVSDAMTDVAVLSVDSTGLTPARLGDSDRVEIGDFALAVGSPFGLSQSVTRGIISAKGRYNLDLGDGEVKYQNFLQTDAAINPGNSGGPLISLRGEVIGLNTAIASNSGGNEGIGFSIPINVVKRVAQQLVEHGEVRWGFLGVTLDGAFDEVRARSAGLPRLFGACVKDVAPGSPAQWARLQAEDVILSFAGVRIEDDDHLISLVKLAEVGSSVELVVFRGGSPVRTKVEIGSETAR